jgi:hypothetical protein
VFSRPPWRPRPTPLGNRYAVFPSRGSPYEPLWTPLSHSVPAAPRHYYRTLTRSGVSSLTYPYSAFEDHLVCTFRWRDY